MNRSDVVSALNLPDSARVDQRVPKKLLLENGAPTASDKRLITDAIEDIQWLAALKPNTIGVPGGKLDLAMQLILTPLIWKLMERRRKQL